MRGPPTVVTEHLLLRPPVAGDVDALYAIQGDRVAMSHTWWAPDRSATADRLDAYAKRFAIDGFAPWTALLGSSGDVVGWGGLNVDPCDARWGAEVSYFIHRAHWGRGLASEIVAAALSWAFGELELPSVTAFAKAENPASIRVLTKSGFELVGVVPELERSQYTVQRGARASSTFQKSPTSSSPCARRSIS